MATIDLRGVDKVFDGDVHAVRDLDLDVEDGELLVLLGPSGCGKSTVLRLVAGLEGLTSGEIHIGERRVDHLPARERDVAMVFQSYALYGHMTVRRNLEFPLRMRGVKGDALTRRVDETARLLELEEWMESKPAALSGGQQQRVAMGRALVREPRAFLLDEPLSNLDARLRASVRTHIARIQARLGVTTLYVTHDQTEALGLGQRVAVLRAGALQQVGLGQELYEHPANTFVAQFLGEPGMNLVFGRLEGGRDLPAGVALDGDLRLPLERSPSGSPDARSEVIVGVRPEGLTIVDAAGSDFVAEVDTVENLGAERLIRLSAGLRTVDASAPSRVAGPAGDGGPHLTVRTGTGSDSPRPGDRVGVRVQAKSLRLFRTDGSALRHSPSDRIG